ncbi:hypothetical protein ASPU41_18150 [Arthrobacter sp. U41]|nr:hypothetical protein ASPU41_18150 [Arthrobacter sp. U41]
MASALKEASSGKQTSEVNELSSGQRIVINLEDSERINAPAGFLYVLSISNSAECIALNLPEGAIMEDQVLNRACDTHLRGDITG